MKSIGTLLQEREKEVFDMFTPLEGDVCFYYGKIRNGKTTTATADMIALLERGEVVVSNSMVDIDALDERDRFGVVLMKFLFNRKYFFDYDFKKNFVYVDRTLPHQEIIRILGNLVGVHIFWDEGQWFFNLANKDDDTRKLILENGHYCRSLNIISQRPINIFPDYRSQVNIWYKCEKLLSWPFLLIRRTTIEDMKDGLPDEENYTRSRLYIPSKRLLASFDTHGMRAETARRIMPQFDLYETTGFQRFLLLGSFLPFVGRFIRPRRAKDTS